MTGVRSLVILSRFWREIPMRVAAAYFCREISLRWFGKPAKIEPVPLENDGRRPRRK